MHSSERHALYGPDRLPDAELLASLLGGSEARRLRVARTLLDAAGSVDGIHRVGRAALRAAGVGPAEVRRIEAALELGARSLKASARPKPILDPAGAYACVGPELSGALTERFIAVALDAKNRPLRISRISEGSVDSCPVDVREVFGPALRERASGVLVAHNHPSGDPHPSVADLDLTQRLRGAGVLLGVPVIDHLIVGATGRWVSLAERGLLTGGE